MLASTRSVVAALRPAPTAPTHPVPYDGPRAVAAEFFTQAREGRAETAPPAFRNGDCVSCPLGTEWMRQHGRWIVPRQPRGLNLPDSVVTGWWQTRKKPGSKFALVHRLTSDEAGMITGDHYTSSFFHNESETETGAFYNEPASGTWLRSLAWQAARTHTVSVHLELPSGIVTLHSRKVSDVFFHPAPAPAPALCA